jgi:motility quorum-sensing regulator/GCU-specific mRNA interferase toxin
MLAKLPFEGNLRAMDKPSAHYSLTDIIAQVQKRKAGAFTKTALNGGWKMGLTTSQMIEAVCNLTPRRLYKSMTTYQDHTVWQDVYHAPTPYGKAYVKVTMRQDGAVVIQFKELEQ